MTVVIKIKFGIFNESLYTDVIYFNKFENKQKAKHQN